MARGGWSRCILRSLDVPYEAVRFHVCSPELVASATERTTAATDLLLAIAAFAGAWHLAARAPGSLAVRIWTGALVAAGLASVLGAVTHGLVMSEALREWLWQPLFLLLGATVACFVAGGRRRRLSALVRLAWYWPSC